MTDQPDLLTDPIRIIVADDQHKSRDALLLALDTANSPVEICAVAADGLQLIAYTEKFNPDLVLTDIRMPLMDGITATGILTRQFPLLRVLALTQFTEDELIVAMIKAGAHGYIHKSRSSHELLEAIITVYNGYSYFCSSTTLALLRLLKKGLFHAHSDKLEAGFFAPNEKEILRLICKEYKTPEIARFLNLTENTVEKYRSKLLFKTGASNSTGLVVFAIKHHIYDPWLDDKGANVEK